MAALTLASYLLPAWLVEWFAASRRESRIRRGVADCSQ